MMLLALAACGSDSICAQWTALAGGVYATTLMDGLLPDGTQEVTEADAVTSASRNAGSASAESAA